MKDRVITIRVNSEQLERLSHILGVDDSKTIRACLNVADFVLQRLFGGEITNIFRREKKDETKDLYKKL